MEVDLERTCVKKVQVDHFKTSKALRIKTDTLLQLHSSWYTLLAKLKVLKSKA
jgi:hypothetical protein